MRHRAIILVLSAAVSCLSPLRAETLQEVKDMARDGVCIVQRDCFVEGLWIGRFGMSNLDNTAPRHYTSDNPSTVQYVNYLESADGSCGVKIRAAHRSAIKDIPRYSLVKLNLKGCRLMWYGQERLEIAGVGKDNIMSFTPGYASGLPVKEKYIHELVPQDVYTYVTLKDCELAFKTGTLINVYETYTVKTDVNAVASPNGTMNSWARLAMDSYGDKMYLMVNSSSPWRRTPAPRGSGKVSGVLVSGGLPRYGGNVLGRFQLRPLDIAEIEFGNPSLWSEIVGWDWGDNQASLRTDGAGRILADSGNGTIAVEVEGKTSRDKDFDNPLMIKNGEDRRGMLSHGSLSIRNRACDWWDWDRDCGKGIVVSFSTAGISDSSLILAFTFSAGDISPASSAGYPVWWGVQVSADGKAWTPLKGRHKLRSLPWWYINNVNGSNYLLSHEAGMGPTEHLVRIPNEYIGKETVYVRIVPVEKVAGSYAMERSDNAALRPNLNTPVVVNFGAISVYAR